METGMDGGQEVFVLEDGHITEILILDQTGHFCHTQCVYYHEHQKQFSHELCELQM